MSPSIETPLEIAAQVASSLQAVNNRSLPEYTRAARLNPTVLIDRRLLSLEQKHLSGLLQTLLSIYSGWYLTAVNMAMTVGNVNVQRTLDQFSTDRSILSTASNTKWGLNSIDDTDYNLPTYGNEDYDPDDILFRNNPKFEKDSGQRSSGDNKETIHNIIEESNLVVGKVLDVKLTSGNSSIIMPVTVTLSPRSIEAEDFLLIAKANGVDRSSSTRLHQLRSGEISFIKDYLLVNDLIELDRKALIADKTGIMLTTRSKQAKGVLATLLSGYASPNQISTMIIISKSTATELEMVLKGPLKNNHTRTKFFSDNAAMMLVVVDPRMERFTMYQRGIDEYSEYTLEDAAKSSKKSNGVDIDSVIKAYKLGDAATL